MAKREQISRSKRCAFFQRKSPKIVNSPSEERLAQKNCTRLRLRLRRHIGRREILTSISWSIRFESQRIQLHQASRRARKIFFTGCEPKEVATKELAIVSRISRITDPPVLWCTGRIWRARSPSSDYRWSERIWRFFGILWALIQKYQRRLTSNRTCIRRFRRTHCRFWSRRWGVTQDAGFTTVCPEILWETWCIVFNWSGVLCSQTLIRWTWEDLYLFLKATRITFSFRRDQTWRSKGFMSSPSASALVNCNDRRKNEDWRYMTHNTNLLSPDKNKFDNKQRIDVVLVQKWSEITRRFSSSLPNCSNCKHRRILWMIQVIFGMWNQIMVEDCFTFPVDLQWFRVLVLRSATTKDCRLTHGTNVNYRKTFFENQFSTFGFTQRLFSKNSIWPRAKKPGCSPWSSSHTSQDRKNQGTIPMPTSVPRPLTTSSTMLVEVPQNCTVGQQRQKTFFLKKFETKHKPQIVL